MAEADAEVAALFAGKADHVIPPPAAQQADPDDGFDPEKYKPKKARLLRWHELKAIAATQQDQWIVRDVVEPGTLCVFSGLPYSGKTTVLAHLMACVATGRPWLGHAVVQRVPVLFVNCDRLRERIVVSRISRAIPDEFAEAEFEARFFTVPVEEIPTTLTPQYLADLIQAINQAIGETGASTGIVVIDPLRAAFLQECEAGAENDPTTMTSVLSPLRRLARVTNWAFILPHHNNRGRDQYAGTAAIPGNTDAMWSISRDEESTVATLRITTRDGMSRPKKSPRGWRDSPATSSPRLTIRSGASGPPPGRPP